MVFPFSLSLIPTYSDSLPLVQVTTIFSDLEESNVLRSYMSDSIEDISKACVAFELKEAAPQMAGINFWGIKVIVMC